MTDEAQVTWNSRYRNAIESSGLTAKSNAGGTRILRWYIDFRHELLNVHKELSAPELFILQHKIDALMSQWDERTDEYVRKQQVFASKSKASHESIEAAERLDSLHRILAHALSVNDRDNWSALKNHRPYLGQMVFDQKRPELIKIAEPTYSPPNISFFDKLFGRAERKMEEAVARFEEVHRAWQTWVWRDTAEYNSAMALWMAAKAEFEATAERDEREYLAKQERENLRIDALAASVVNGEAQAVIEHASLVLENSNYGNLFEKSYEIDYVPESKTLMVEYQLPSPDGMPTVKSVRFVASTGKMEETYISDREQTANYDSVCYQICLRTIYELIEADESENVQNILFNGISTYIDRTIGLDTTCCIMSILVNRDDFLKIDLAGVDPKACFKSLKGVSASSLAALTPIPPVMELNKEDRRFIDAREVAETLDPAINHCLNGLGRL